MKIFETQIIDRKEVAQDTLEVSFVRPADFDFKAGQYVQVELPIVLRNDAGGSSRVFSIVSSPDDSKKLTIAFRRSDKGFKRAIEGAAIGTTVRIQGPYGYFTFDRETHKPLVLIAGGIGITPCLSMIRFAQTHKMSTPMTLVYANRDRKSAAYLNELEKLEKGQTHMTLWTIFRPIDQSILHEIVEHHPYASWLIAGPPGFVEVVRNGLHIENVHEHTIFFEEFQGY